MSKVNKFKLGQSVEFIGENLCLFSGKIIDQSKTEVIVEYYDESGELQHDRIKKEELQ